MGNVFCKPRFFKKSEPHVAINPLPWGEFEAEDAKDHRARSSQKCDMIPKTSKEKDGQILTSDELDP